MSWRSWFFMDELIGIGFVIAGCLIKDEFCLGYGVAKFVSGFMGYCKAGRQ